MNKQILIVDDERPALDALCRMLRGHRHEWDITCTECPVTAWTLLLERHFDAVISDMKMPGMSGLELLSRIHETADTRDLPVVMLTGLSSRELKRHALDLGAADLLNKPVDPEDLVARIRAVLRLKAYQDELKLHNELLEQRVQDRTRDLYHARLDIIWRLGKAAEHRDDATGNHVVRVGCNSRVIADRLGMNSEFLETLSLAAPLHDIGKIGIPDAILLKRGELTPQQWHVMKDHCRIGANILREDCLPKTALGKWCERFHPTGGQKRENPVLEMGAAIALMHHEKWDGTGYPQGIAGEDIPLAACIVAISDVFDAITSRRPYKNPYPLDHALHIIRQGTGTHFAPDVFAAFMHALPDIQEIRRQFADEADSTSRHKESVDEANPIC